MTHHVIAGAGPAALNAIETIRDIDGGQARISLVCDEPPYSRMVLPYWLAGRISEGQVFTADDAYLDRLKVERHFGRRVAAVDGGGKKVSLDNGQTLAFDNLLIATGSSATLPPVAGTDLPGVQPLWTLEDAHAALRAAEGIMTPEVLFVGAGFIGFTVINAFFKRGWRLHIVEMAPHVLPRMLDRQSAGLVERWLQAKGVGLYTGTTAQAIEAAGRRKRVKLADGRTVECDVVVLATGIRPNMDFLKGSGIAVDQAILVDERMRTNVPGVYAAGDVAQGPDLYGERPAVHALQPTAVDHGRIAGANMAGQDVRYPGSLLMNILDVCGLQCASFGRWSDAAAETMTILNPERPVCRKLLWTGDRITGAVFVGPASDLGMLNDVGMVKGLLQTRTALGAWKEYLKANPFDIRRPYVGLRVGEKLAGSTLLGRPSKPRDYRYEGRQPGPQVTNAEAHGAYVRAKEY